MVIEELAFELLLAYAEWHDGVLRAERPAESAMWRSGWGGNEKSSWCVLMNRFARSLHREDEYIDCGAH